jgi:hypothetical protein
MASGPERFRHFAAIDWSGAAGERLLGIAVALCGPGRAAPRLVRPGHRWSRAEVAAWLAAELPEAALVGIDSAPALPFLDAGAYFPGWAQSPADARGLWALVEAICAADPHLAATSFCNHPEASRHFRRHGGRAGDRFGAGRGRLRVTEHGQRAMGLSPYSCMNLVGAAQVGKSSLTTMRMLNRLAGLAVWPFDPLPPGGPVLVEIYTALAARAAGGRAGRSKLRDAAALDAALAALGCGPSGLTGTVPDHASDAILTAAWLRAVAHDPALWSPASLTPEVAQTEGWTFGVP